MGRRPGGWDEKHMIAISIGTSCADGRGNLLRGQVSLYLPLFNPRNTFTGLPFSSGRRRHDKGVLHCYPTRQVSFQRQVEKAPRLDLVRLTLASRVGGPRVAGIASAFLLEPRGPGNTPNTDCEADQAPRCGRQLAGSMVMLISGCVIRVPTKRAWDANAPTHDGGNSVWGSLTAGSSWEGFKDEMVRPHPCTIVLVAFAAVRGQYFGTSAHSPDRYNVAVRSTPLLSAFLPHKVKMFEVECDSCILLVSIKMWRAPKVKWKNEGLTVLCPEFCWSDGSTSHCG